MWVRYGIGGISVLLGGALVLYSPLDSVIRSRLSPEETEKVQRIVGDRYADILDVALERSDLLLGRPSGDYYVSDANLEEQAVFPLLSCAVTDDGKSISCEGDGVRRVLHTAEKFRFVGPLWQHENDELGLFFITTLRRSILREIRDWRNYGDPVSHRVYAGTFSLATGRLVRAHLVEVVAH